ncbi:cobalt-precorrin 5A hydrolase [Halalkalibacter urbisdiaboli]|uniref:cobalt-precorrin 5A hydrolase n=1 Tax=Halalkalibacter urbisdiaboli TaxID=1960589 RepID=UPI000B42E818|nr:cobalamin biosynthesis protein [Halalkalibacter urbisdiaboli]
MDNIALVAITKHGTEMVRNIHQQVPTADVYYMSKHAYGDEAENGFTTFEGSVRLQLPALFEKYDGIVMVISLGAVIRMVAPILKGKKVDPAVVVIDDRGQFVISALSGHVGGANELTAKLADLMGATPVITTASDVQKTIPVDIFGREFGWTLEDDQAVTPVSAAVVNEEPVLIVQEAGEKTWWKHDKPLPKTFNVINSIEEASQHQFNAALVISDRVLSEEWMTLLRTKGVLYRPKTICLGVGCNRGTSAEEIETVILETLAEERLSPLSVHSVSTIDLKKDEKGLLAVCEKHGWDFIYYSPEQLNEVSFPNPSDTVFKYTGAYGVSEPASLRTANTTELLVEKKKSGNVTVSISMRNVEAR